MIETKFKKRENLILIQVPYENNNIIKEFLPHATYNGMYWVTEDEKNARAIKAEIVRATEISETINIKAVNKLLKQLAECHTATRTTKNRVLFEQLQSDLSKLLEEIKQLGYTSQYMNAVNTAMYNRPDRDKIIPLNMLDTARAFSKI